MKYLKELGVMAAAATEAGQELLSQNVEVIEHKSKNDLLTKNDIETENRIIAKIRSEFPDINIVSEENNPNAKLEGLTVVIDPIDGTCNYAAGLDLYGVQMALFDGDTCVAALMYFPASGDMYTAIKGEGAFKNGQRIRVNRSIAPESGILLISDYYSNIEIPMDAQFNLVKSLQDKFLKTRHFGAACVDFAMMANSNAQMYITYYHKIWDIAPGLLIATEAGCSYSMVDGSDFEYGKPGLIVCAYPQ